jgi:D-alanine-D-alanine ligase
MDKAVMKQLCQAADLPTVDYIVLERGRWNLDELKLPFNFPVFVKPANLGSSVGVTKAKTAEAFRDAVTLAARYDHKIVVERGIQGREFECAVLDGDPPRAAMPCEILPSREFYDYEDKYLLNQARIELPANVSDEQRREIQRLAVGCFEAVNCEGMGRVDFLLETSTGVIYVNEINTIPGFTSISMYPKMWEYSGLPYSELLDTLIDLAIQRGQARRQLSYTR